MELIKRKNICITQLRKKIFFIKSFVYETNKILKKGLNLRSVQKLKKFSISWNNRDMAHC